MSKTGSYRIAITGVVQGVGFRPFVYNLATGLDLNGWVLNHSGGVDIEVAGQEETLALFIQKLREEAPPLSYIESLAATPITPQDYKEFEIRHSEHKAGQYQLISPDVATCQDCVRELFDPQDRRYRYPFTNCTNCGPRFTIIADIPYDRPNTTMHKFPLCPECNTEYQDPRDRRFHAQPNACHICGPHLWLTTADGEPPAASETRVDNEAVLAQAKELLLDGKILAIKGLGGFHLACDATNAEAVRRLRARKHRPNKPFAVMVPTLDVIRDHCEVPAVAEELIKSPQCPIVLLDKRPASTVVGNVAPNSHTLGMMIPYTPLHHLLLNDIKRPLVMTSGNLTEEPIAKDNAEALHRLAPLADAFLLHNRDIYARYDDSVWQVIPFSHQSDIIQPVRRARGYAPYPIRLPFKMRRILATGPLLKNTFCLTRDHYAFLSQHIGDMENLDTLEHYEAALETYKHLFRLEPQEIVCDMHPDYLTTEIAIRYAQEQGLPAPLQVQHHHAHIAACLADNGWLIDAGPVIGVALDGTGYGTDGAIWGAEWLVAGYNGFERAAHLEYLPLPGGDAATRNPWRIAVAYLHTLLGPEAYPVGMFCPGESAMLRQQIERRINTPETSSMGRLFDAVSALLGICHQATYEAQAAIELEQAAGIQIPEDISPYAFEIEGDSVRVAVLFEALLAELRKGTPVAEISRRFHATIAHMVVKVSAQIRDTTGINTVALSGGVFQNRLLLQLSLPLLEKAGFKVLRHRQVPCNDGGVSLGQAVIAQSQEPVF